jgi:hypothetical protein
MQSFLCMLEIALHPMRARIAILTDIGASDTRGDLTVEFMIQYIIASRHIKTIAVQY